MMRINPDYLRNESLFNNCGRLFLVPWICGALLILFGCATNTADPEKSSKALSLEIKPGDVFQDCAECPEMVAIQPGSFIIGNDYAVGHAPREVIISKTFAIATTETTVEAFRAYQNEVSSKDPAKLSDAADDREPMVEVNWFEATNFAKWLTAKTGFHYRLPTEEEWEYAARGGTTTRYWWGDNWRDRSDYCYGCSLEHDQVRPIKVKSYPGNPFGLYDTAGNVYEWVNNCWNVDELVSENPANTNRTSADCEWRIIRGGSWTSKALSGFTSDRRLWTNPDRRSNDLGFRLVREI